MGQSSKAKKLKSLKTQLKKGGTEKMIANLRLRIQTLENTKK